MDLSEIKITEKSNEGARMEVIHPVSGSIIMDGENKPMWVMVAGRHSDHYVKSSRKVMDRRLKNSRGKKINLSSEQIENESTETLARCVLDWYIIVDGKVPGKTFEEVYAVLMDPRFRFLRDQIDEFVDDESNFI